MEKNTSPKHKNPLDNKTILYSFIYVLALVVVVLFVRSALQEKTSEITEKAPKEKGFTVRNSRVHLKVFTDIYRYGFREYEVKLTNVDSVMDFIEHLRKEEGLTYERISYVSGTEFESILGIIPPEGYVWNVYKYKVKDEELANKIFLTNKLGETMLEDDDHFTLELNKIEKTFGLNTYYYNEHSGGEISNEQCKPTALTAVSTPARVPVDFEEDISNEKILATAYEALFKDELSQAQKKAQGLSRKNIKTLNPKLFSITKEGADTIKIKIASRNIKANVEGRECSMKILEEQVRKMAEQLYPDSWNIEITN